MTSTDTLDQAVTHLGDAVDRLEAGVLQFLEGLVSRRLVELPDDPAILRAPLVRGAGIRLEDVYLDREVADAPTMAAIDPQAAFVALAEQAGSYQLAAREHPEAWAAYRAAADLNGQRWEG